VKQHPRAARIALLNDLFRRSLGLAAPVAGRTVVTATVAALDSDTQAAVFRAVATFTAFTADNDPWGEHDCATFEVRGERFIWKIDYYADENLTFGAEDASTACYRVLTIMRASDY